MALSKRLPKRFNWYKLPNYLESLEQEVQSLQISNMAVGKVTATAEGLNQGVPLIVGQKYYTSGIDPGDDLTNVGWVADEVAFIATGTTPTVWVDSNINIIQESITLFYNDIDSNISANYNIATGGGEILITNGLFDVTKTYPVIEQVQTIVVDNNTLRANLTMEDFYFKIEVYV